MHRSEYLLRLREIARAEYAAISEDFGRAMHKSSRLKIGLAGAGADVQVIPDSYRTLYSEHAQFLCLLVF